MSYELFSSQINTVVKCFNHSVFQLCLFILGVSLSVFYGIFFLRYVSDYESLFFYVVGMVVPLLPSVFSLEDW